MAPKKKEQKMSYAEFMGDENMGSWADEMDNIPDYSRTGFGTERRTYSATTGTYGSGNVGGYSVREELPLPDKPPYTVHLGNLSFDATTGDVNDFFSKCQCTNVRIIEDKMDMKPKGFGYAEFASRDGLKLALTLNGSQFQGRNIRISVADPPKDRGDRQEPREISDWSRKGPLPDLPSQKSNRRESDRGFGFDHEGDRKERFPESDGKVRDLGNWERKGPLSPITQPPRGPREGGRSRTNDEAFRDRRSSPAAWGEGRQQGNQEGSRPPRREFQDRPAVERVPTAAEQDNQWRTKMRPDVPVANSSVPSRDGSETSSSPAPGVNVAPSRPKLNLTKRTVPDTSSILSPSSTSGDAKASPFGAAKPIDTATKEKEIEEKRLALIKEKREADLKANEEKLEAAKALKELEEKKKLQLLQNQAALKDEVSVEKKPNGNIDEKSTRPTDATREIKTKPADTGAWRRPSNGPPLPRDDIPRGPRNARGGAPRGRPEGHKQFENRSVRQNLNGNAPATPQELEAQSEAKALEEDGWSTVSKPKRNNRGGNYGARAIAS
ncbi:hypothetical protein K3495_g6451 [Podosphaera aphanis]|nr:hypothetical protein K3495_g6451 [Podosphaera aphanis]